MLDFSPEECVWFDLIDEDDGSPLPLSFDNVGRGECGAHVAGAWGRDEDSEVRDS